MLKVRLLLAASVILAGLALMPALVGADPTGPSGATGAPGTQGAATGGPSATATSATSNPATTATTATTPKATASGSCSVKQVASATANAVKIGDYCFSPTTVTAHVGDTMTWTNKGGQSHTATACKKATTATANGCTTDPSIFFVGTKGTPLKPGQSGTAKLKQTGTFSYICELHPSLMHGTIKVLASTSGNTSGNGGASGSGGTSSSTTTPTTSSSSSGTSGGGSSGSLPSTGVNALLLFLVGANLLLGGLVLRERGAHRP